MSLLSAAGSPGHNPTPVEPPSPSETTESNGTGIQLPGIIQNMLLERKKREWAGWAATEYVKCRNARLPFERQWFLNIAFTSGRQYLAPINVPGHGFRLQAPKAPPWRVRLVINKVRTAVRTEASKLTSNRPIPTVLPATNEDEDFSAALVAEQILKTEFATATFDKTFKSFVWWGVVTGNGFLKSYWDAKHLDEEVQPPPQPNPMEQQLGLPVGTLPSIQQPVFGKIKYERVNPFHIYVPDLLAEDIEKQPYIMHVTTRNPLWVEKNFGFKPTCDSRAANTIMEAAILAPAGASNEHMDSVLVKEVWLKPDAHIDFPEGGVLTIINDKVVQVQEKWPWPFKEYPFYKYDGIPTGGFYTESIVTDLIPIQKEYNRTKSQIVEIKNMMGKPKIMAPRGSINPRQISSEPGQAILYTAGFGNPPTILPPADVPSTMPMLLDRLQSDFDDISGQHEITRGNTPSQVTSGTAIAYLQEQDDSKLVYQIAGLEAAVQKLGTHYLKYVQKYWNDERLIRIVGADGTFEALHWKGDHLRGNTDVRVVAGSALPFSKAAKTAMITEFMNNGQMDPQTGMELLEMPGFEKAIEDVLVDKRQAQRENMKMANADPQQVMMAMQPPVGPDGAPIDPNVLQQMGWQPPQLFPVNSYDNHDAHLHYHNQFRKTQKFELLPEPIKQVFEQHCQMHQMAMQTMLMNQQGIPVEDNSGGPTEEELAAEESAETQGYPQ